jgi:hypothetical protein
MGTSLSIKIRALPYVYGFTKALIYTEMYCTVGWVDIGTVAREPMKIVACLKKVGEMAQKFV